MTVTTKIGLSGSEATVKNPAKNSYKKSNKQLGGSQRTADGTRKRHITATKGTWSVTWEMLDSTERSTLVTELNRQVTLSWQPPEGSTYSVQVDEYSETPQGVGLFIINATLEEV